MEDLATALEPLEVVCFWAAGFRFAIEAYRIRGMAAPDCADATAVAIEQVIGLPPDLSPLRHVLEVAGSGRRIAVSGPVGLEALAAGVIFPLPPLVAARMALAGIRALALPPAGPVLILDLPKLLP